MTNTLSPCLDIDNLRDQIIESAKQANGVRYPSERATENTLNIIQQCWEEFNGKPPQEGEFVKIGDEHHRIAYVTSRNDDGTTTFQPAKSGSVYLFSGHGSFSGSLDSPVTMKLKHIGWEPASFWIFWDGSSGAHRGVQFKLPTRVFSEVQEDEPKEYPKMKMRCVTVYMSDGDTITTNINGTDDEITKHYLGHCFEAGCDTRHHTALAVRFDDSKKCVGLTIKNIESGNQGRIASVKKQTTKIDDSRSVEEIILLMQDGTHYDIKDVWIYDLQGNWIEGIGYPNQFAK